MQPAPIPVSARTSGAVPSRPVGPESLWYKEAVFYEVHVRAFRDSNGDGIGDFVGLTQKLDYLQSLGVTTIWLLPFYPSPLKDDGYDIADYVGVHADYGTIEDFQEFLNQAHRRGLRVVIELVLNHTSDQHAWFQRARRAAPGSPERDFYVWSQSPDLYSNARIIFKDFELSNWTWDPIARALFWHRFYSHQPDLNYGNPRVVQAMLDVVDFWLDLGVDGLRLDAVPYLAEAEGTASENLPETHRLLKQLRQHIDKKYADRMLLAEANQWPEAAAEYFGNGDECHMAFHFPLMPRLFMALRQEGSFPILDILSQTPDIPDTCQWALFLRNHDELTLEMVTEEERLFMWNAYAHDREARINLGIRRRLAPLLRNDRRRMELMNALLLSMPGTPVLYYGDEIGMGDNVYLGDRNGVRTPMQWEPGQNAGFSDANPQRLYMPVSIDPEFHYIAVNVASQEHNPSSLLNWMRRILSIRKRHPALGRGKLEFMDTDNRHVIAYQRRYGAQNLLVVANLARFAQHFTLQLTEHAGKVPVDLFGRSPFPQIEHKRYPLSLGPHGFIWFSLEDPPDESGPARPDYQPPVIELRQSADEVLFGAQRVKLEQILPAFLRRQPWFHGDNKTVLGCTIQSVVPLGAPSPSGSLFLMTVRTDFNASDPDLYLVPIAIDADSEASVESNTLSPVIAFLKYGPVSSTAELRYAAYDPRFVRAVLCLVLQPGAAADLSEPLVVLETEATDSLRDLDLERAEVRPVPLRLQNAVAVVGERAVVKLFHRLQEGINPDVELARHLMARDFPHAPRVAGALQQVSSYREGITLAVVQPFVENEGTAWEHALRQYGAYLARAEDATKALGKVSIAPAAIARGAHSRVTATARKFIGSYLDEIALLGRRVAEMHLALASEKEHPALAPEHFTEFYQRSLYQRFRSLTVRTFSRLSEQRDSLPASLSERIGNLANHQEDVLKQFEPLRRHPLTALRIRCHGNLHLENVLCTGGDFVLIDFEGEASLPLYERRLKASPLTDIISLIRSIFYVPQAHLVSGAPARDPAESPGWMNSATRFWQYWVAVALLQSYRATAKKSELLPTGADFESLFKVLFTSRTVYELGYEQTHRPGWLTIPLNDLLEIVEKRES